jgi:hypothetical protein
MSYFEQAVLALQKPGPDEATLQKTADEAVRADRIQAALGFRLGAEVLARQRDRGLALLCVSELRGHAEHAGNDLTAWRAYTRAAELLEFALGVGPHPDSPEADRRPEAPKPTVVTSAKEVREKYGWLISDEEFERRFPKGLPYAPHVPEQAEELMLATLASLKPEDFVTDQVQPPISSTMDPEDPKRVLVQLPSAWVEPRRHGVLGNDLINAVISYHPITGGNGCLGLDFTDEKSKAWAAGHAPKLQAWLEQFFSAYSARPVLLDGYPSANPQAIYVGRLLSLAANGLRAAFPDTPLNVEERLP